MHGLYSAMLHPLREGLTGRIKGRDFPKRMTGTQDFKIKASFKISFILANYVQQSTATERR